MNEHQIEAVLSLLEGCTLAELISHFLSLSSPLAQAFLRDITLTLETILGHPDTQAHAREFLFNYFLSLMTSEVTNLATKESGWHFSARNASASQIQAFSIENMASQFEKRSPILWRLLGTLLLPYSLRSAATKLGTLGSSTQSLFNQQIMDEEAESEYWAQEEERLGCGSGLNKSENDTEGPRTAKRQRRAAERTPALHRIKRVVIVSILIMSKNQRCNALPSIIGIFCHSTSMPELAIEMLAHMGLSISLTSIHNMVSSLSDKSHLELRRMTSTLTASFAYDYFDIDFQSWLPTIEKPGSTLKHATSALAFPLSHGVTADDLRCSAELWTSDPYNISIPRELRPRSYTWMDCLPLPEPAETPSLSLRLIAWHFRHSLVTFVEHFSRFSNDLHHPETVLKIPHGQKTPIVPCRSMDINQSTSDGQAQIIENILAQAHLGDPTDTPGVTDIREYVSLWHGDLRTGELIDLARRSRSIESKPVRRLQFPIFIMGLFHYQMACVDAIWRMFIEPIGAHQDPEGLYQQICRVRPHDSGRIASKPSFHMMHDIIHQCAYARMLDCWRLHVKKLGFPSLEAYGDTKPSWDSIIQHSLSLAQTYLDKPTAQDEGFRNNSLILARLIQYVELSHTMKHGDIGRVEATFLHWIFVFKSVGKHKYATHLIKTIINMRYRYNDRLKYAIRSFLNQWGRC
ncbi:hypothetical protein H0H93_009405 [Arthromyces matolae]|nr:hypothetical protein H0H93_009405 [Arthromyces matolae]